MRRLRTIFLVLFIKSMSAQEDLAKNGTASQSTDFRTHYASLATTGGPTHKWSSESCSATNSKLNVSWWMLEFPSTTVFISNVIIYYRSNTPSRLAGYYLFVTNNSISSTASSPPNDGHLCYHHSGNNLPNILQNVTCGQLGQNVIIYNERKTGVKYPNTYSDVALLELCDVQVIGCYKSWWGGGCRKPCPTYCTDQHCDPTNGTCIWGCSHNKCLNNDCYNDGICASGCVKGQGGLSCNRINVATDQVILMSESPNKLKTKVVDGDKTEASYVTLSGADSWIQIDTGELHVIQSINLIFKDALTSHEYSIFVSNSSGDRSKALNVTNTKFVMYTFPFQMYTHMLNPVVVGRYVIVSKVIFSLDICEVEILGCQPGFYGDSCDIQCPRNCDGPCNPENGYCIFGCKDGYIGFICDQACPRPKFGKLCIETCHCTNQPCNFVNGTCPLGGCQAGWEGHSCSKECGLGKYGKNCEHTCAGCLLTECDAVNGTCKKLTGCRPGWKNGNPMCNEECDDGYFGDCSTQCYCREGICVKSTGVCPNNACERGWMGNTCNEECSPGTFGYNCANTCDGCVNKTCDIYEGNCTFGCLFGYGVLQCQILGEKSERQPQPSSSLAGSIGGGIGGTLVVVVITIAVVFFIRRRSSQSEKQDCNRKNLTKMKDSSTAKRTKTKSNKRNTTMISGRDQYVNVGSIDTRGIHMSHVVDKEGSFCSSKESVYINHGTEFDGDISEEVSNIYSNIDTHRYAVDDLQNIIQEKRKSDEYQKDFENLPKGLLRPHGEGSKEENKKRNRFLTTWPYDHSRVVLSGCGTSDYINASYIDSYTKKRAYIATQGPKQNTVKEFWHMVWQENVEIIVMLTKVEENGKKKCYQYWPSCSTNQQSDGHFTLSLVQETTNAVYVYRKIRISSSNEKKSRDVHHFQYLQWDDHDVADTINLINFYWKIKRVSQTLMGPLIVHCSAGIGRTGTFIAIDALYENGIKTGFIDVLEYVEMMRQDRMNMIQTQNQYATVYEALLEAFTVPDSSVDQNEFSSCFERDDSDHIPKNQRKISVEYRKLLDVKPCYAKENFKAALLEDNISKNANQQILAHDKYRPYLMSYGKCRTDYINAVIIPSYVPTQNIYVTQYPLQTTVVDFWTLIYDTDCSTVVILETINDRFRLLPEQGKPLNLDIFEVSKESCTPTAAEIKIKHKEIDELKQVDVLFVDDWLSESTALPSEKCMLKLLSLVLQTPSSIVVVCRDGCVRSGIFVALYLTMRRMEKENAVDLFHAVRTMQIRRPEFCPCPEQYQFCYKCIRDHLEMDSLYANV